MNSFVRFGSTIRLSTRKSNSFLISNKKNQFATNTKPDSNPQNNNNNKQQNNQKQNQQQSKSKTTNTTTTNEERPLVGIDYDREGIYKNKAVYSNSTLALVLGAVGIAIVGCSYYFIIDERKSTRPYKLAMVYLKHAPELKKPIGNEFKDGWWVESKRTGNRVCMRTHISGTNGSGTASFCSTFNIHAVALQQLIVSVDGTNEKILIDTSDSEQKP